MATNLGPELTPIDPNIVMLVNSYFSRIYIERETDFKTTFLANFALTTHLTKLHLTIFSGIKTVSEAGKKKND
jgi:hypothetical protein